MVANLNHLLINNLQLQLLISHYKLLFQIKSMISKNITYKTLYCKLNLVSQNPSNKVFSKKDYYPIYNQLETQWFNQLK